MGRKRTRYGKHVCNNSNACVIKLAWPYIGLAGSEMMPDPLRRVFPPRRQPRLGREGRREHVNRLVRVGEARPCECDGGAGIALVVLDQLISSLLCSSPHS
jgi:hypothetical protein